MSEVKPKLGVPMVTQQKWIWLASIRTQVRSLASLSGLRMQCCWKLLCRLPTWLRSHVAGWLQLWFDPSLGTPICHEYGPKKQKYKQTNRLNLFLQIISFNILVRLANFDELHFYFFFFFFFFFLRAAPMAYGSSQARDWIRAMAAGLFHSHSNAGSLTNWVGPGIEPTSSWLLIGLVSTEPQWELPTF